MSSKLNSNFNTFKWSLRSVSSSLISFVVIYPFLFKYLTVHVEPPTVTVYLKDNQNILPVFYVLMILELSIGFCKICLVTYLTGVAILQQASMRANIPKFESLSFSTYACKIKNILGLISQCIFLNSLYLLELLISFENIFTSDVPIH